MIRKEKRKEKEKILLADILRVPQYFSEPCKDDEIQQRRLDVKPLNEGFLIPLPFHFVVF